MATKGPKMVEIRDRSNEELEASLSRARRELFKFMMSRSTNQLENTMQIRAKRKEIARILTVLSGRAKGIETQGAGTDKE